MQRNGERIAEPIGARHQQRAMGAEKEQRDVRALRGLQYEKRKKHQQ